jgi:hypothetical protein
MIIVKMHNGQEVRVDADSWEDNGGDGDLECFKGGRAVARFRHPYWYAVYESAAVISTSANPAPSRFHDQ